MRCKLYTVFSFELFKKKGGSLYEIGRNLMLENVAICLTQIKKKGVPML